MKKYKSITVFIILILFVGLLAVFAVKILREKHTLLEKTAHLNRQVATLKQQVSLFRGKEMEDKETKDVRKFQENAFRLRFPHFTETVGLVFQKSKEYGFNPYLVMAVIQVESNFDPFAVSTAGAYGLMQINYSVWKDELKINFNRIFDKEYNLDLGLKILRHYYDRSAGNLQMALFRYNNGYNFNNTEYNVKIIATRFYPKEKTPKKAAETTPAGEDNRSI